MREKELRTVVAFHTTTDAMAVESYCVQHGVPGRIIPLPAVISAGCGLCWSAPDEAGSQAVAAAQAAGVSPAGVYQMLL